MCWMITVTKVVNGIQYHCVSMPSSSSSVKSSTWWIIALIVTCVITIQIQLIVIFSIDSASGKFSFLQLDYFSSLNTVTASWIWFEHNSCSLFILFSRSQHPNFTRLTTYCGVLVMNTTVHVLWYMNNRIHCCSW